MEAPLEESLDSKILRAGNFNATSKVKNDRFTSGTPASNLAAWSVVYVKMIKITEYFSEPGKLLCRVRILNGLLWTLLRSTLVSSRLELLSYRTSIINFGPVLEESMNKNSSNFRHQIGETWCRSLLIYQAEWLFNHFLTTGRSFALGRLDLAQLPHSWLHHTFSTSQRFLIDFLAKLSFSKN